MTCICNSTIAFPHELSFTPLEGNTELAPPAGEVSPRSQDVVQLMELEGRTLPSLARSDLQNRLRGFRSTIGDLKSRLKGARSAMTPDRGGDRIREDLFAGHSPG